MSKNGKIAVVSAVAVYVSMLLKIPAWIFFLGMTSAFVGEMDTQKIVNSLLIGFFGCLVIFYSSWLSGIVTALVVYFFLTLEKPTFKDKISIPVMFLGGIAVLSSGIHGPLIAEVLVFAGAITMFTVEKFSEEKGGKRFDR